MKNGMSKEKAFEKSLKPATKRYKKEKLELIDEASNLK